MAALISNTNRELMLTAGRSFLLNGRNSAVLEFRRLIRGLRRRPVAVLSPDGERETLVKPNRTADRTEPERDRGGARPHAHRNVEAARAGACETDTNVRDPLCGLRFEKARPGDKRLAKVVSIARYGAFRDQQGKILLEGRRLICDALAAGAVPQTLFFSRVERLCELPLDKLQKASLVKVKFEDIKVWSELVTPQGVLAIFSKPDASRLVFPKDLRLQSVPLFLICDNVRDPGNLGTILRCAAAAGCDRVLLTNGCVDAWEPKVLRAAMGAHFRLPIFPNLDWAEISDHLPKPATVHVADDGSITKDTNCNTAYSSDAQVEEYIESDSDHDSEDDDDELSLPHVEPKVYYENWAQRHTALVIGGETRGLSLEALQLAKETDGHKLFVPVAQGVNSLNPAMTASILLFEGRKQLMKVAQKTARRARSVIH